MIFEEVVMKKKIGTIVDSDILIEAKKRAVLEGRALSDIIHDALVVYLRENAAATDSLHAWEKFCSHGRLLGRSEIDDLLAEDMLVP